MNRSVTLDSDLVQSKAKSLGIFSQAELTKAILEFRNDIDGKDTKAGYKAWNGIPLQRNFADEVARILGFSSHRQLLDLASTSLWNQVRNHEENHQEILKVLLKSETKRRRLFSLSGQESGEEDWKIKKNDKWCLRLSYQANYYILALIRDKGKHVVITPSHYGFPQHFEEEAVTIPDRRQWLDFSIDEGNTDRDSRWREIVVICCKHDIFPKKTKHENNILDESTLERIAAKLLSPSIKKDYVIDSVTFELVD
jgi:hypothetical protein